MPARPATRIRSRSRRTSRSGGSGSGRCSSGGSGERGGRGGDGPRRAGLPRQRGYGVAAGRGAGRVPARFRTGRVTAHRGAGRGVSRVHLLQADTKTTGKAQQERGLRWQTRITNGAAAGAVGWARRLAAHPEVGQALAAGDISASWAREICSWTARLPEGNQADADAILLAAAAGGAELADLAGLAEEMRRRCAAPDSDGDGGFADRWLRLDRTLHDAGRVEGDLTPQCTAALNAVLDAFSRKAGRNTALWASGPMTAWRKRAAADRLRLRAGPGRAADPDPAAYDAGSAARPDGAAAAEAAWAARGAAAAPGSDCDAVIVPVVSGHVDPAVLDQLTAAPADTTRRSGTPGASRHDPARLGWDTAPRGAATAGPVRRGVRVRPVVLAGPQPPHGQRSPYGPQSPKAATVRGLILRHAADLLSGPAGLAAFLRTGLLDGAARPVSLPLDVGQATKTIPDHLRRAVIARDRCCRFPAAASAPPPARPTTSNQEAAAAPPA